MDVNADYAEMYRQMARAAEQAIRVLVKAQQECEEMYIKAGESKAVIKLDEHRGDE